MIDLISVQPSIPIKLIGTLERRLLLAMMAASQEDDEGIVLESEEGTCREIEVTQHRLNALAAVNDDETLKIAIGEVIDGLKVGDVADLPDALALEDVL